MMSLIGKIVLGLTATVLFSGCIPGEKHNKTVDGGIDSKHLSQLQAGIWIDPNGCDHWIIDDGIEGYLSQRLDKRGKPVCSGIAPPTSAVGPYKRGSDPI
jgi:hypothetical protein